MRPPTEAGPTVRGLLELVQLLQMHREVSSRLLAGDSSLAEPRARLDAWIAQQYSRLPGEQRGLMAHAWRLLGRMVRKRSVTADESDALHAALIRRYLVSAERLSEAAAAAPEAGPLAEAIDGLRNSLCAGKLAIQSQLRACFRALGQRRSAA